jgi:hypothetical protein
MTTWTEARSDGFRFCFEEDPVLFLHPFARTATEQAKYS